MKFPIIIMVNVFLLILITSCSKEAAKGLAARGVKIEAKKTFSSIKSTKKEIVVESPENYLLFLEIDGLDLDGQKKKENFCVCIRKKMKLRNMFVTRVNVCTRTGIEHFRDRCKYPNDIDKKKAKELGIPLGKDLYELALRGDIDSISSALGTGEIDINRKFRSGNFSLYTAIFGAVHNNQLKTLRYLISKGANPNIVDHNGNAPIHYKEISLRIFKELILARARMNIENNRREVPIYNFLRNGKIEIIKNYLNYIKSLEFKNEYEENLINVLFSMYKKNVILRDDFLMLLNLFATRDVSLNNKSTRPLLYNDFPIIIAVESSDIELVEIIIKFNANLNLRSFFEKTPLMIALENKSYDIAKLLIGSGADINLGDGENVSPLLLAIPNFEMVQYIVEKGFELNYANIHNLLRKAKEAQSVDIYDYLKEKASKILKEDEN